MQRVSNGYTVIEVMIFLAITAIMMITAMNLVSGRQAETQFNQKMRDTRSKIQDWLNDVSTGFPGGDPANQNCIVNGNRPEVDNGAPGVGYSPSCIFIGKAIQFTDISNSVSQSDKLYAYSIFGCRLTGCNASGALPSDLAEASPSAAVGKGGPTAANLTQEFSLSPAQVKSVSSNSPYSSSHMIGLFSSFNTEQSTLQNGNSDITLYQFNFSGSGTTADQPGGQPILNCLELQGSCGSPQKLTDYKICLSDGRRTAQITISTSDGVGAATKLDYVSC